MNTKNLVKAAVLLALGFILHIVAPPLIMGIKPDFLLAMMFVAITLDKSFESTMMIAIAAGIITGITTTLPNGLMANVVDKLVTGVFVFSTLKFVKFNFSVLNLFVISLLGTVISGSVCLIVAFLGDFNMLIANFPVVIVTAILNAIIVPFVIKLMHKTGNRI